MSRQVRNTFGHLSGVLKGIGFSVVKQGDHVIFTHRSGRPMILLPSYKSSQAVKPIHLMMVRKQLTDAGLMKSDGLASRMQAESPVESKP